MDLERVERELRKRLDYPYRWGKKQSDDWDNRTNFIYTTYSFRRLLERTAAFDGALRDYALNRWYNFWSAKAVEYIFSLHGNVEPNINKYDKRVDFYIEGIPFDHKTSVFPKGFKRSYAYARAHEEELIYWLYMNQSQEKRKHLKNRLFVILYDGKDMQHWKLKAYIGFLKHKIDTYMGHFSKNNLHIFDFGEGRVYSDILWVYRDK
ncbi:hypothetical protein [Nitratifractor salsuginis]|uniref:Uncharacterized protein n=1 Tax=Nitratifractor salsuginis (strain DSM 16511 / JCM 12458 / E9I37-1) TaxID=749222 RepID=E6WZB6_NITSE|nr:hypothetical protein [Nitratifractor salsuginis]ADV46628.1 hypothetical protein Nitsa_1377 [Nitratifractor salsuginis DSM 16511]